MKNSENLRHFSQQTWVHAALAGAALVCAVTLAGWWFFQHGYILYYGDAQSHLNLSRSIIDSRTPGYDQLGTVWLPILHVICLALVSNMQLWSTGLAGTIPVALCFVIAGIALFLAGCETYRSRAAGWVVILCLITNANLLYLASIPMTEVVFLAGVSVLLLCLIRFEATLRWRWVLLGVVAAWWMCLTRYDGWFLIPFAALWFAWPAREKWLQTLVAFGALAALAPLYWVAHNWWETSNPLDFYNGPYSAMAIQGDKPYPGYHNWLVAAQYYAKAGQLCAGWTLLLLGIAGLFCVFAKGNWRPALFLLLTPAFYVWSIHSSRNPIFVPQLPPHGYYNSRYGIAVVVFAAFACGGLAVSLPVKWKRFAWAVPVLAVLPWILKPSPENWICWKESDVNSQARRAWTRVAAEYFRAHYVAGQGILTPSASGDLTGILCRARIPLRETINVGNGPLWMANTVRPDLVHQQLWILEQGGNITLSHTAERAGFPYDPIENIMENNEPPVQIWRRIPDAPLH